MCFPIWSFDDMAEVRDMQPQNPPIMVSLQQGRKGVEQALEGAHTQGSLKTLDATQNNVVLLCFAVDLWKILEV